MVPRPRARVWARLHRARAQHLIRRSTVTHGDRGFPRARWARPGASGALASYRDLGRADRQRLTDKEARSDRLTVAMSNSLIPRAAKPGPSCPRRRRARAAATPGRGEDATMSGDIIT